MALPLGGRLFLLFHIYCIKLHVLINYSILLYAVALEFSDWLLLSALIWLICDAWLSHGVASADDFPTQPLYISS